MPSFALAALAFLAVLASGLAGLAFSRIAPAAGRSRVLLAGTCGLVGLLLAGTLARLTADAQGVARAEAAAVQRLAADALAFDLALKAYGPDAAEARRLSAAGLAAVVGGMRGAAGSLDAVAAHISAMNALLAGLTPATEAQRQALATAGRLNAGLAEARLRLALPPAEPVSRPLLLALISWACLVFAGLGALSRASLASAAALALGGAATASAILLIIELSQPLTGSFRLSPSPIERSLTEIAP